MCRLLAVRAETSFSIIKHLRHFAHIAQNSKKYQGCGWGCAYLRDGSWHHYKNIKPIWKDDLSQFESTTLLLAHARSAFRNQGIIVENNMPFYDETNVFIFNGELHGVTIKETGRTGAEKVFNFIKRFDKGNMLEAMEKGIGILNRRARFVKAMNMIVSDSRSIFVASQFNEKPDYFTMYCKQSKGNVIICSEAGANPGVSDPYPAEPQTFGKSEWKPIDNNTIMKF